MKGHMQKQFHAQRTIIKKTIQSLVQQKHQIRIQFLNNQTCQVQKIGKSQKLNRNQPSQGQNKDNKKLHEKINFKEALQKLSTTSGKACPSSENLFEVIYRNRSRIESIGWHEEVPLRRTSKMSRTYRRRRRSHLQSYQTINEKAKNSNEGSLKTTLNHKDAVISNFLLNCFTNEEILKKSALTLTPKDSPKNGKQSNMYPQILAFAKEAKFKRMEFVPPNQQRQKSIFEIARNRMTRKWKYQTNRQEGSKSARQMIRPAIDETFLNRKFHSKGKQTIECKTISPTSNQHPFLKQIKPLKQSQTKSVHSKRILSTYLHYRPNQIPYHMSQKVKQVKKDQVCRPWSVFQNYQQKIDESKQIISERMI